MTIFDDPMVTVVCEITPKKPDDFPLPTSYCYTVTDWGRPMATNWPWGGVICTG